MLIAYRSTDKNSKQTFVCLLFGSSSSGKSTLCKHLKASWKYESNYSATDRISFSCNRFIESSGSERYILVIFILIGDALIVCVIKVVEIPESPNLISEAMKKYFPFGKCFVVDSFTILITFS